MSATFSVGVDMDSLHHYLRIHGLRGEAGPEAWTVALDRFLELFEGLGLKASFYCVAEDLSLSPEALPALLRARAAGHEIANHSWRHPYALTRLPLAELRREVSEGKRLLEEALDVEVLGFRAPGYNTSAAVSEAVFNSGHIYESSAFPCAPYYIAKALVMALMRARGKVSQSILASPRLLCAPRQPYHPDPSQPYRHSVATRERLHAPISVYWGAPLIGTALSALGPRLSGWLMRRAAQRAQRRGEHLTLEFHAIDLLSLTEDGLDERLSVQPDLRLRLAHKRRCFEQALKACHELSCVRLVDYAQARLS